MFRELRADEIEARIAETREQGVTLLLYKNARCDMGILDETVGPMGWQRRHELIGGVMYCSVGIRSADGEWVWKQDAGVAGSFEAEKSQASDSFKRACTNWGIGRELYTAPRIWIPAGKCTIKQSKGGRPVCYDAFEVVRAVIEDYRIRALAIRNATTGKNVFVWMAPGYEPDGQR